MENIDISRPEIELAAAVGGVWSLVRFADKINQKDLAPDLEAAIYDGLRETIHESSTLRDLFRKFLNMPDERQTDERLNAAIGTLDLILMRFERLFRLWDRRPAQVANRLAKQIEILAGIVDDLLNIQETLALGRSVTFQAEIAQARSSASR